MGMTKVHITEAARVIVEEWEWNSFIGTCRYGAVEELIHGVSEPIERVGRWVRLPMVTRWFC
jgi:hypothetical protein